MSKHPALSRRTALATGAAGILSGALSAQSHAQHDVSAPQPRRVLRLAHLTDVHVQPERAGGKGFAACLRHVQAQKDAPEMIVFGGDNVMNVDGEEGRTRAQLQLDLWNRVLREECSLPYKVTVGNHDVLAMHPVDGKKWAVDAFELPARHYTHDQAGWRFVFLDSTSPAEGGYKGRLDGDQFAWLEEVMASTQREMPICIISHIPILAACTFFDGDNEETGDWVVPGAWMHLDARALKDLFQRHANVKLCISGHAHLADSVEYLGVKYCCNGAVSGGWWRGDCQEFAPGYALVDLYSDGTSRVAYETYGWHARED